MKLLYPTLLALAVFAISCRDNKDADSVTPKTATPVDTTKAITDIAETARLQVDGWLTDGQWIVDTLSVKVYENNVVVGDTAYFNYGTYSFAKTVPANSKWLATNAKYMVHVHPGTHGDVVRDSLGYWVGNAQTGTASKAFLSMWNVKKLGSSPVIYSKLTGGKNLFRYENRITMRTSSGKDQVWVRQFRIHR